MVFQTEKKSEISQILQFRKSPNFYYLETQINNQASEIVEFQNLENFQNLPICKTIKIPKNSNLLIHYQICISSVRIIQTIFKIKNQFENRKIE